MPPSGETPSGSIFQIGIKKRKTFGVPPSGGFSLKPKRSTPTKPPKGGTPNALSRRLFHQRIHLPLQQPGSKVMIHRFFIPA